MLAGQQQLVSAACIEQEQAMQPDHEGTSLGWDSNYCFIAMGSHAASGERKTCVFRSFRDSRGGDFLVFPNKSVLHFGNRH